MNDRINPIWNSIRHLLWRQVLVCVLDGGWEKDFGDEPSEALAYGDRPGFSGLRLKRQQRGGIGQRNCSKGKRTVSKAIDKVRERGQPRYASFRTDRCSREQVKKFG